MTRSPTWSYIPARQNSGNLPAVLSWIKILSESRCINLIWESARRGIPYAEPPTGTRQFRRPVLKTSLNVNTFNATQFGSACLQQPTAAPSSEDCLTLNVFRPAKAGNERLLPVVAWIHGGGFVSDDSSNYNASSIVSQSVARGTAVLCVILNYRLGPLGFPTGQEAASAGILNLGLRDQLAALEWIKHNIANFGGDSKKVTIYGQSAGAVSIANLFLNPILERYARAVIFQSGSAATGPAFNASHGQVDWDHFIQAIPECHSALENSTSLDCIRQVGTDDILNAFGVATGQANALFPWYPTIDGPGGLIPDLPSKLFDAGHFARLPFISGTVLDEGSLFVSLSINSTEEIKEQILSNFTVSSSSGPSADLETAADDILQLYPDLPELGSPYNTGNDTFGLSSQFKRYASIAGDLYSVANRRALSQTAAKIGVKCFSYIFANPPPANTFPPFFGVPHGLDLGIFFGQVPGTAALPPSAESALLAEQMIDYWLSFVTFLDPNDGKGTQRPLWTQYGSGDNESEQVVLQLKHDNVTVIPDNFRAEQMEFINSHQVVFRH
ncbi:extracellular triacylglycerol lipase precursor [Mycena polygramma]|nr:extracellular triacylglycerol lipase precursor [Mycena polygramma]